MTTDGPAALREGALVVGLLNPRECRGAFVDSGNEMPTLKPQKKKKCLRSVGSWYLLLVSISCSAPNVHDKQTLLPLLPPSLPPSCQSWVWILLPRLYKLPLHVLES